MVDNQKIINMIQEKIHENKAISLKSITTAYPDGFVGCREINFDLNYNEIHCLLGENGSGKTTLVKTLFGEIPKSSGKIFINGKEVQNHTTQNANFLKMGIIHQHFSLIEDFTVFENLILGHELRTPEEIKKLTKVFDQWMLETNIEKEKKLKKTKSEQIRLKIKAKYQQKIVKKSLQAEEKKRVFWLPLAKMKKRIAKLNKDFDLNLNLEQKVKMLTLAEQQKTEILKLLIRDAQILIFDEPTSVLDAKEIKTFLKLMKNYRNQGKAIIFITHKIEEILEVGDRVTVMSEGNLIGTYNVKDVNQERLINLLAGKKFIIKKFQDTKPAVLSEILLEVKNIDYWENGMQALKNVNLKVHKGEIVGIVGIENNGQRELLEVIAGMNINFTGDVLFASPIIYFKNRPGVNPKTLTKHWQKFLLHEKKKLGIAYIPQSRINVSLLPTETLATNLVFNNLEKDDFFSSGFLRIFKNKNVIDLTNNLITKYQIKGAKSPLVKASFLSGGNQQKFIIARELENNIELLLVDQPTWGIDVLSKNFVYKNFLKHRNLGRSLLFASSNMNEVLSLSDRVLVMSSGQIVGEVNPHTKNAKTEILNLITKSYT